MHLIPAIDILGGKCVRLTQGDYDQKKVYSEHPLEVAKAIEGAGLKRLHVVDLDGARAQHIVNWRVLEEIATRTSLFIDFGGGLKTDEDLSIAFERGAGQVTGGTVAVKDPDLFTRWIETYGPERIILGADAREGRIAVSGWLEETRLHLLDFLGTYQEKGIQYVISTDISKDGKMEGPATDTYRTIRERFPGLRLIASGGITTAVDVETLHEIGCYGAIIGKALYEGRLRLEDLGRLQERLLVND